MGSVTQWIDDLQTSQASLAQQELWKRSFERLVQVARDTLDGYPQRIADGEDVALGALHSFFAGARKQRFSDLNGRDNLWPLLVVITKRRAINQIKREGAKKRGGGHVRGHSVFDPSDTQAGFEQIAAQEPSRELLDDMNEEIILAAEALSRHRRDAKEFELLRHIIRLRLENYSSVEIGKQVDKSERTVQLRLALIRDQLVWNHFFGEFSDALSDANRGVTAMSAESESFQVMLNEALREFERQWKEGSDPPDIQAVFGEN